MQSYLILESSNLTDNFATKISNGVEMVESKCLATNVTVNYTDASLIKSSADSGFFSLYAKSNLTIENRSLIKNSRGKLAGAIYATSQSNVTVRSGSTFMNGRSEAGILIGLYSTNAASVNQSKFFNNSAINIYVEAANLTVNSSLFEQANSTFISAKKASVFLNNTVMANSIN